MATAGPALSEGRGGAVPQRGGATSFVTFWSIHLGMYWPNSCGVQCHILGGPGSTVAPLGASASEALVSLTGTDKEFKIDVEKGSESDLEDWKLKLQTMLAAVTAALKDETLQGSEPPVFAADSIRLVRLELPPQTTVAQNRQTSPPSFQEKAKKYDDGGRAMEAARSNKKRDHHWALLTYKYITTVHTTTTMKARRQQRTSDN